MTRANLDPATCTYAEAVTACQKFANAAQAFGRYPTRGGKPRKLATFRAPHGATVVVQIGTQDMSRHEEFAARVASGNGSELEIERVRPDGMTEIITIMLQSQP